MQDTLYIFRSLVPVDVVRFFSPNVVIMLCLSSRIDTFIPANTLCTQMFLRWHGYPDNTTSTRRVPFFVVKFYELDLCKQWKPLFNSIILVITLSTRDQFMSII